MLQEPFFSPLGQKKGAASEGIWELMCRVSWQSCTHLWQETWCAPEEGFWCKIPLQNLQLLPHPGQVFSDETWWDGTLKIKSTNKTINWKKTSSRYFQSCSEGPMSVFCIFTPLAMHSSLTWLCTEQANSYLGPFLCIKMSSVSLSPAETGIHRWGNLGEQSLPVLFGLVFFLPPPMLHSLLQLILLTTTWGGDGRPAGTWEFLSEIFGNCVFLLFISLFSIPPPSSCHSLAGKMKSCPWCVHNNGSLCRPHGSCSLIYFNSFYIEPNDLICLF